MQELNGKVAVVTGAASGIGLALTQEYVANGMHVVMADVEAEALTLAAKGLQAAGAEVLPVVTDVSDRSQVEELRRQTLAHYGHAHVICNNAGVAVLAPTWEIGPNDWQWVLSVNLGGVVNGITTFLPLLMEQGEGHIVNTASMAGVAIFPGWAPYTASKHAVVALSETLSMELDAAGSPVGVSVLCPGFVDTKITDCERNRPATLPRNAAPIDDAVKQALIGGMPPEEVARMVVDAILRRQFWVFTHPEMKPAIELRVDSLLNAHNPAPPPSPI